MYDFWNNWYLYLKFLWFYSFSLLSVRWKLKSLNFLGVKWREIGISVNIFN